MAGNEERRTWEAALLRAGWHSERKVWQGMAKWRLSRRGYDVHEAAARFLEEYGGLTLRVAPEAPSQLRARLTSSITLFSNFRRLNAPARRFCHRKPPDVEFLASRFKWKACYIGWMNFLLYSPAEEGAFLYALSSGEFAICPADWLCVFRCEDAKKLWSFLVKCDINATNECLLDGNLEATKELYRLGLIKGIH